MMVGIVTPTHLTIQEPVTQLVVHIPDLAVVINIKHLTRLHPNPKKETPYSQGTSRGGYGSMGGLHIPGHLTTPGKIRPLQHFLRDTVVFPLPDETVRTGWCLLPDRGYIKADFDLFTDKMLVAIIHHRSRPSIRCRSSWNLSEYS